jgi:hypothetical protein
MDKLLHQNPSCSFSPRWKMVLPKKTSIEGNSNTIKLQCKHPLLKREKGLKHPHRSNTWTTDKIELLKTYACILFFPAPISDEKWEPTHSLFLTGWPSSLTRTGLGNTWHILPWDARVLHQRDYVPKTHFCVFFFAPLHLGVHEEGNSRSTWKQQYGCGELWLGTNS